MNKNILVGLVVGGIFLSGWGLLGHMSYKAIKKENFKPIEYAIDGVLGGVYLGGIGYLTRKNIKEKEEEEQIKNRLEKII
jgi:hypothetical protein